MTDDRLPLTLLSGLSTSLREQALVAAVRARPDCVAVVYDVEPALGGLVLTRRVIDTGGEHDREPVELVGCCLACTVRADVGSALDLVGAGRWREVLLSVPSSVSPRPVAAALTGSSVARVDTLAVVVDALLLHEQLRTDDLLADRGLAAAPTDRRSTADVLVGQVEEADVLLVAGLHRLPADRAETAAALLAHLAPLAQQVALAPDGRGAERALGTGRYDGEVGRHEREQLATLAAGLCPPACGVSTVLWTADRPLHPQRLHDALEELVAHVVRSRGTVSLAGRPGALVRWESAGPGLWFSDPEPAEGTPRCELVLTGVGIDPAEVTSLLEACLALPDEVDPADPFRDVLGPALGAD